MDTSDSENFESAGEEVHSDTEDKNIKANVHFKSVDGKPLKFEELTIIEENSAHNEKNTSTITVNSDNSTTVADKLEKRNKPMKPKLGVKLGTKITMSKGVNVSKKEHLESACREISSFDNNFKCDDFSEPINDQPEKSIDAKKGIKEDTSFEEEVNMWADDEWEPVTKTEDYNSSSSGWGNWGNWDVTSLLSSATTGVTIITNHVSQGLSTVLESGMGVPDPEELARSHKRDREAKSSAEIKNEEHVNEDKNKSRTLESKFGLGSLVSGVSQITKLVETTGNKVISSGLDTLETIGKKTMEVLQEGDPGLKKKRAFLRIDSNKPVLSHILREAKEKAEQENKVAEERHLLRKANYETLFDDHQGLVHLEALEMLSKQCDIKLKTLLESQSAADFIEMQETLNQIKELCEITEEDEEENELEESEIIEKLETAVQELNITISYDRLLKTWKDIHEWLGNVNIGSTYKATQLHEESINNLAQLTAVTVELFHKIGELLLIKPHRSTVDEADSLVQLTTMMTILISDIAKKASDKLNEMASQSGNKDNINQFITNVYFEATNSNSYINNSFELLIPVLQVGAV